MTSTQQVQKRDDLNTAGTEERCPAGTEQRCPAGTEER